jgi:hypothetical protein
MVKMCNYFCNTIIRFLIPTISIFLDMQLGENIGIKLGARIYLIISSIIIIEGGWMPMID